MKDSTNVKKIFPVKFELKGKKGINPKIVINPDKEKYG